MIALYAGYSTMHVQLRRHSGPDGCREQVTLQAAGGRAWRARALGESNRRHSASSRADLSPGGLRPLEDVGQLHERVGGPAGLIGGDVPQGICSVGDGCHRGSSAAQDGHLSLVALVEWSQAFCVGRPRPPVRRRADRSGWRPKASMGSGRCSGDSTAGRSPATKRFERPGSPMCNFATTRPRPLSRRPRVRPRPFA
jgi:hypothetical protein